jgi:hypothetical protein
MVISTENLLLKSQTHEQSCRLKWLVCGGSQWEMSITGPQASYWNNPLGNNSAVRSAITDCDTEKCKLEKYYSKSIIMQ